MPRTAPISGKDVLMTLVASRRMLSRPGAWTQGEFARDARGRGTLDYPGQALIEPGGFVSVDRLLEMDEDRLEEDLARGSDLPREAHERAQAVHSAAIAVLADEIRRIRRGNTADLAGEIRRNRFDVADDDDEALVEAWNEKKGRTQAQVVALLDSAIARLRPRQAAR